MRYLVVLDTNAVIAALPRWSPYRNVIDELIFDRYDAVVTTEIFLEYEEKLKEKFDAAVADWGLEIFKILPNVYLQEVWYKFQLIQNDPDDDKFVDCAFAANAHFIVTNDKDFNVLKTLAFPKISLLKIEEFSALLLATSQGDANEVN